MEHAWLDSLSEDWVSQPSDGSHIQLPPQASEDTKPRAQDPPSRIPRKMMGARSSIPAVNDNSVLSERSANEINMASQRLPSKLSRGIKSSCDDSNTDVLLGQQAVLSSITWSRTGHHLVKQMGKHPSGSDGLCLATCSMGSSATFSARLPMAFKTCSNLLRRVPDLNATGKTNHYTNRPCPPALHCTRVGGPAPSWRRSQHSRRRGGAPVPKRCDT